MKKTKYILLNIALFLSLMGLPSFASGQTEAGEQTSRLVVSFYSICCGINQEAKAKLDSYIKRYERTKRKKLTKVESRWGREGEIDYCFQLAELSRRDRTRFISNVRSLLKRSKLVNIKENETCQSGR